MARDHIDFYKNEEKTCYDYAIINIENRAKIMGKFMGLLSIDRICWI